MKPEGSVKVAVLNGSRQVDQVVNGEWLTMKVLPEAGLPKGIHQLSDAKDASKNVHPHKHVGQVLHDDGRNVYQFSEGGIVKHSRGIFEKPPVVGKNYEIAYSRGQGKVIGEVSQEQAAKAEQKRSRSIWEAYEHRGVPARFSRLARRGFCDRRGRWQDLDAAQRRNRTALRACAGFD